MHDLNCIISIDFKVIVSGLKMRLCKSFVLEKCKKINVIVVGNVAIKNKILYFHEK